MQHWYLVRTKRHREFAATAAIADIGIQTYLPVENHWSRHARKLTKITAPLFRQYLFVFMNLASDPWWRISRCMWIERIFSHDHIPVIVPARHIEMIQAAEKSGEYDLTKQLDEYRPRFPNGTKVRITDGPFIGLHTQVRNSSPERRVEILLQLLGSERPLWIDEASLEAD